MSTGRRLLAVVLALVVGAVLPACGGDDTGDAPPTPTAGDAAPATTGGQEGEATDAAEQATLTISEFSFAPVSAAPQSEITVVNTDQTQHTVTANDEAFDVAVDGGATGSFTAPEAEGEYPFRCRIHPNMEGTLTVG